MFMGKKNELIHLNFCHNLSSTFLHNKESSPLSQNKTKVVVDILSFPAMTINDIRTGHEIDLFTKTNENDVFSHLLMCFFYHNVCSCFYLFCTFSNTLRKEIINQIKRIISSYKLKSLQRNSTRKNKIKSTRNSLRKIE